MRKSEATINAILDDIDLERLMDVEGIEVDTDAGYLSEELINNSPVIYGTMREERTIEELVLDGADQEE